MISSCVNYQLQPQWKGVRDGFFVGGVVAEHLQPEGHVLHFRRVFGPALEEEQQQARNTVGVNEEGEQEFKRKQRRTWDSC